MAKGGLGLGSGSCRYHATLPPCTAGTMLPYPTCLPACRYHAILLHMYYRYRATQPHMYCRRPAYQSTCSAGTMLLYPTYPAAGQRTKVFVVPVVSVEGCHTSLCVPQAHFRYLHGQARADTGQARPGRIQARVDTGQGGYRQGQIHMGRGVSSALSSCTPPAPPSLTHTHSLHVCPRPPPPSRRPTAS